MFARTTGFGKKLLSVFTSCALAASLAPAASLAYAAEPTDDVNAQEVVVDDMTIDDATASGEGMTTDRIYESVELDASSSNTAESAARESVDIVSDSVSVDNSTTDVEMTQLAVDLSIEQTIITYAGLNYIVNEDDQSVTLTGLASAALTGDLRIPNNITSGGDTYAVTNIRSMGGGVQHS